MCCRPTTHDIRSGSSPRSVHFTIPRPFFVPFKLDTASFWIKNMNSALRAHHGPPQRRKVSDGVCIHADCYRIWIRLCAVVKQTWTLKGVKTFLRIASNTPSSTRYTSAAQDNIPGCHMRPSSRPRMHLPNRGGGIRISTPDGPQSPRRHDRPP